MTKLADTIAVQTDYFTVKDCVLHWQFSESNNQKDKVEVILIAGYQFTFAFVYIGDCAEAVVFQFEDAVWIIKRLCNALEAHGLDAGEQARTSWRDAITALVSANGNLVLALSTLRTGWFRIQPSADCSL